MVLGGYPLFFVYGFASLAADHPGRDNPPLHGWPWWSAVLSGMFNFTTDSGWISLLSSLTFLLGFGLLGVGIVLTVTGLVRRLSRP
jgi:hypothetical protein